MEMAYSKAAGRVLRLTGTLAAVAVVTVIDFRVIGVNSATAAFTYLLLILGLATRVGLFESIAASLASVLAYNFFFLPPVGTLNIADPQNWVALFVFLVTAVTASELSVNARLKAEEAGVRQQELHRIYEFSRALMLGDTERHLADQIAQMAAEVFGVPHVCFYESATDTVFRIGAASAPLLDSLLRETAQSGNISGSCAQHAVIVPVRLGGKGLGSLGVAGFSSLSEVALQAMAQLAAIALERARAQDIASRVEAARQNERLKSVLLDALAHEFKTPLTSIKAATTSVLSHSHLNAIDRELLTIVDQEADRLTSLVSEAIDVARISVGQVVLHREPYLVQSLISSCLNQLRASCEGRNVEVSVPSDLPFLDVDVKLTELVVRQLLNNSLKYAPPSSPIRIAAEVLDDFVVIRISNDGPGIPLEEQERIFEKFYRGREWRELMPGTGMGLTIARQIVEAHGGRIWVESAPRQGVRFFFTLPAIAAAGDRSGREHGTAA